MSARGYIFDYGGTLDTKGNHWGKVIWHAYERIGVPVNEEQYREAYVHAERTLGRERIIMPHFTFRDTLSTKLNIQLDYLIDRNMMRVSNTERVRYHAELLDLLYSATKDIIVESREVLTQIAKECKMVLVSNFYGNIETVLREFGLEHLFVSVIESAVVGIRKPNARIFALGVDAIRKAYGTDDVECIVVGDSMDKDIIPAKSIGCTTVWYEGEQWKENETDTSKADKIIHNIKELL